MKVQRYNHVAPELLRSGSFETKAVQTPAPARSCAPALAVARVPHRHPKQGVHKAVEDRPAAFTPRWLP